MLNLVALLIVLALTLSGVHHPLAVVVPLMLLGVGHDLIVPSTLAGAVGAVPALAGAAAAMAGMLQQIVSAGGSYVIGFFDHSDATNLTWFMLFFTLAAIVAQWLLWKSQSIRKCTR